jgi:hypothetical protein
VAIFSELTKILYVNAYDSSFLSTAENTVMERAGEKFRKNRDEIEAHDLAETV